MFCAGPWNDLTRLELGGWHNPPSTPFIFITEGLEEGEKRAETGRLLESRVTESHPNGGFKGKTAAGKRKMSESRSAEVCREDSTPSAGKRMKTVHSFSPLSISPLDPEEPFLLLLRVWPMCYLTMLFVAAEHPFTSLSDQSERARFVRAALVHQPQVRWLISHMRGEILWWRFDLSASRGCSFLRPGRS